MIASCSSAVAPGTTPTALPATPSPQAVPSAAVATLPSADPLTATPLEPPVTYSGLQLERLGVAYQTTFDLRFEGDFVWRYQLESRTDQSVAEHNLHLEGVDAAVNPGDVRVVVADGTVRMRGPGTDDECIQFPGDVELGLAFLTPDDIIDPHLFAQSMIPASQDTIAGAEAIRYALRLASLNEWQNVALEVWLDRSTGAVLRYDLHASGPDPLFEAGQGTVSGQFLVREIGRQVITPIEGCDIELPLPADVAQLAKLPGGLVVFESLASVPELTRFYQDGLAEQGWEASSGPQMTGEVVLLTYRRGGETLDIRIEPRERGVQVQMLLGGD